MLPCTYMDVADKKPVIGILGGICSGKSTVAREFARLGCGVIDADEIAHELLETNQVKGQLREVFGKVVFDSKGGIDRVLLGETVFENKENVDRINRIIHPLVLARTEELISELNGRGGIKAIVLDMPLLVEAGWAKKCDKLVFVGCKEEICAQRSHKKGLLAKKQLKKRKKFQISLDKKVKIADYIVDNNSDLSALAEQVSRVFSIIINNG